MVNLSFLRDLRPLPELPVKKFSALISASLLVLAAQCWGHADRVDDFVREQMQTWHIQWRYSNSNYYLLGQIIEKVSGKKYEEFLYEHIFQPLEMKATRMTDYRDTVPNRAAGYNWLGEDVEQTPAIITGFHGTKNVMQNAIYISPTRKWAAGAIASSVNDLVKWDQSLRTDKLLLQPADE